jgi:hypothetical protein
MKSHHQKRTCKWPFGRFSPLKKLDQSDIETKTKKRKFFKWREKKIERVFDLPLAVRFNARVSPLREQGGTVVKE